MNNSNQPWPAPAKLNLFLHILGRREDGYHLLQTVFQFLDYGDEIIISVRKDDEINLNADYVRVDMDEDLVVKAAKMLQQKLQQPRGADIQVNKRLPIGGGLGGGSSDAATTLVALNKLWDVGLSEVELAEMGLILGADVPVFVYGCAAWAEGVGERLTPVSLPDGWFIVIYPGFSVSTEQIFASTYLTRNTAAITIRDFLAGAGRNDCESVACMLHPEIENVLRWLDKKAEGARMTGTGSCVFSVFHTKQEAQAVLLELPQDWQGFVAHGKNTSPLLDRLAQSPGMFSSR
ncbi:MAG: 4-(cytidine 5'-diphospho)-2-C-methyl-D-erythritol kinase [Gammaproteobacteria bacterium]|nr:4-(cytidine 5'-diphospho)-2-C-methyl-D-erythritol kinase [Gammaproteobacteria bacterium]